MNRIIKAIVIIILVAAAWNINNAQPIIPHGVLASGGGITSDGTHTIAGTIGQPMRGVTSDGTHTLSVFIHCGFILFRD